jgi:hypothetical protein
LQKQKLKCSRRNEAPKKLGAQQIAEAKIKIFQKKRSLKKARCSTHRGSEN